MAQTDFFRGMPISSVQVLDLNDDGNPDFGVHFSSNSTTDEPQFYTSNARGVLHYAGTLGLPPALWVLTDVNGDGRLDAVLADFQTGVVSVTLQPPPARVVPNVNPDRNQQRAFAAIRKGLRSAVETKEPRLPECRAMLPETEEYEQNVHG
jgi:hypothetical protein